MFARFISVYSPFTFLYINPTNPLWYFGCLVLSLWSVTNVTFTLNLSKRLENWTTSLNTEKENKNLLTIKHDNHLSLSIPDHHKIIYEVVVLCICKRQSVKIIYSILKIACNWQLVEMHFGRQRAVCVYSCVFAAFFQIYFHLNAIYFSFFFPYLLLFNIHQYKKIHRLSWWNEIWTMTTKWYADVHHFISFFHYSTFYVSQMEIIKENV